MNKLLDNKILSRVRRNHGLEHATLHVLGTRFPGLGLAGLSDAGGFWLIGNVELDDLTDAAVAALARLRAGEQNLAIHPNCGTNYATMGAFAGFAAWLTMLGAKKGLRDKLDRLPNAIILSTLALMFAQPLAYKLQSKVTTSGVPGQLELTGISVYPRGGTKAYRISTKG
jgi:hypothetical protein